MASPLSFGLELEMHAIRLTFRQRGTNNFWPTVDAPALLSDTLIGKESILVPMDPGNGFINPNPPHNVIWESNWGFRAVGDAFAGFQVTPDGLAARQAGSCVLELATAASPANDVGYWISSRLSAKAFVASMDHFANNNPVVPGEIQDVGFKWYPLQAVLDDYNNKIQALAARPGFVPNRFKLVKSDGILALENGTHDSSLHQWDAYFRCSTAAENRWCDVQVNYQMSLRTLYTNLDQWIAIWDSIWAYETTVGHLDPNFGDIKQVGFPDMYKIQAYAAMWRLAKARVDVDFNPPVNVGTSTALVKGLITYLLVASSITAGQPGHDTSKNSYPQLPKTSPVSIAREIEALQPAAAPYFAQLATVNGPSVLQAELDSLYFIRNKAELMKAPGNLPQTAPVPSNIPGTPGSLLFTIMDGGILSPPNPPNFKDTWYGTFNNVNALTALNKNGFVTAAPFYVTWAFEVNSSLPATLYNVNEIKILFESRYGRNKLNLGFNPYIQDFMFNRSYMSLVRLLAGLGAAGAVQASVNALFPDDPAIRQNFKNGVH